MEDRSLRILPDHLLNQETIEPLTANRYDQSLIPIVFALNTELYDSFQELWHSWQLRQIPADSDDQYAAELLQDCIEIGMKMLGEEMYAYPLKRNLNRPIVANMTTIEDRKPFG